MDDEKLKKLFENMDIPEPSEDARARALRAAMEEFEARKEKASEPAKGISWFKRLMGKTAKGGSLMNAFTIKRLSLAATAAVALIVISIALMPEFSSIREAPYRLEKSESMKKQYQKEPAHATPDAVQSEPATGKISAAQPKTKETVAPGRELEDRTGMAFRNPTDKGEDVRIAAPPPPAPEEMARLRAGAEMHMLEEAAPAAKPEPAPPTSSPILTEGGGIIERKDFLQAEADMEVAEEAAAPAPSLQANRGLVAKSEAKKQRAVGYVAAPPVPSGDIVAPPAQEYVGRDQFEHKEDNPVKVVREEPVSTFSIDVDTASYAFVRRSLMEGVLPQKDAVRVEEMINYFDYDYPAPADRKRPFRASVAVYPTPWNRDTMLLHIGIKGHEVEAKEKPHSNLVFLLDVSGSMQSPDKLPLLKNSMRMLVDSLGPEDTVGIVVYAGAAGAVLEPTPVKEKHKILAALDRLDAGGSTAGAEGIRQAYAMAEAGFDPKAVNRVILATDGDFNVGITNREELKSFIERKRESGIYLSVLGFGQGNYNDALMQALAQNGNGVAAYIDTLNEARKVLVDEASSTLYPIATDVKIQVEFNPARVAEYRLIGYETRMLRREDFNNDKVDAGDIGSGHTVTAIYEITPVGSPARMVEDLRYTSGSPVKDDTSSEYAFLRLRYKLPGEKESRLIERPIGKDDSFASVEKAPAEMRFASSVAAFGQILKGGRYIAGLSYDDVISLAGSARGDDPFGYRAEFLNLVRLTKNARAMGAH